MKSYQIRVTVKVQEKGPTYPEVIPVSFEFAEALPADVRADIYLRRRIAEELTRNFSASTLASIENQPEPVDPLES